MNHQVIWNCINCQKTNNTKLNNFKLKEDILISFQKRGILIAKCKKCKMNNEFFIAFNDVKLSDLKTINEKKCKRSINMIKINKNRANEKKEKIFSLLSGLFAENYYLNGIYDIKKIANDSNVSISTAKKYVKEYSSLKMSDKQN